MTNEELVREIKMQIDVKENMLLLYANNHGFIYKHVTPYTAHCEREDLMQEAYIALDDAVKGYDPRKGVAFLTYLKYWIKSRCGRLAYNAEMKRLPVYMQTRINKYYDLIADLERIPTKGEAMRTLDLSSSQYEHLMTTIYTRKTKSLDEPFEGEEGDSMSLQELIDSQNYDIDELLDSLALSKVWDYVEELPKEGRELLKWRYDENKTLQEIADYCGCSRGLIGQKENQWLRKLGYNPKVKELGDAFGMRKTTIVMIDSKALYGNPEKVVLSMM